MAARRRIDLEVGSHAVRAWLETRASALAACKPTSDAMGGADGGTPVQSAENNVPADRSTQRRMTATAVRFCLEELAACAPGRAVEVRVPPYGATQAVAGTTHRRGTPPSVVETDSETWLALATGMMTWEEALATGVLHASGERCDLSPYLPLMPGHGLR